VIEYLAIGLAWLLLPLPFAVFIGKCIEVGQAGETARHAPLAAEPETTGAQLPTDTVDAEDRSEASAPEAPALPAQRQPTIPAAHVS
jgi:hypothetical protein